MAKFANSKQQRTQATKKFTDREEPRALFQKHLKQMSEEDNNKIHVLNFHGFGGIGKSELLSALEKNLIKEQKDIKYVYYDFASDDGSTDPLEILRSMERILKAKYKFSFPIFDLVAYTYEQKIGHDSTRPELDSIIASNRELSFLRAATEEIPLVSVISKIITIAELAETGKNLIKERLANKKFKEQLTKAEQQSAFSLKNELGYYFAQDLNENLKNATTPLVVFLDTYEILVNEFSAGLPLEKDLFLRGENGLITNAEKVLWVISGREVLKWQELDSSWEGSLDSYYLKRISFKDSKWFLNEAGIEDEELIKKLYELTKGNPMYLDLCVDTYYSVKDSRKTPTIDDFGKDTTVLVNRFCSYMDDTERDLLQLLSHVDCWNDNNAEEIIRGNLGTFSQNLYDRFKRVSFVTKENNSYKINELVRPIVIQNTPERIHNKYVKNLRDKISSEIEKLASDPKEFSTYESEKISRRVLLISTNTLRKISTKKDNLFTPVFDDPLNPTATEIADLVRRNKDSHEAKLLLQRFIRNHAPNYDETNRYSVEDFEEICSVAEEVFEKGSLFLAKLYVDCPKDYKYYDKYEKRANDILVNYDGPQKSLYIETALTSLGKNTSSLTIGIPEPLSGMGALMRSFASLWDDVNGILEETKEDLLYDDKDYQDAKKREQYLINKKVKTSLELLIKNPHLFSKKILTLLFYANGEKLGFPAQREIFAFTVVEKDFVNKTTDKELLEGYYSLIREFLGGTDVKLNTMSRLCSVSNLAIPTLRYIRPRYEDVFGKDSLIVAEIKAYIRKAQIEENPEALQAAFEDISKTAPVGSSPFDNAYRVLASEYLSILEDKRSDDEWLIAYEGNAKSAFSEKDIRCIEVFGEWAKKCFKAYDPEEYVKFHEHVFSSLISLADKATHRSTKLQQEIKIYTIAYNALKESLYLYSEEDKFNPKYDFFFKFIEGKMDACLWTGFKTSKYAFESFEETIETIIKNGYRCHDTMRIISFAITKELHDLFVYIPYLNVDERVKYAKLLHNAVSKNSLWAIGNSTSDAYAEFAHKYTESVGSLYDNEKSKQARKYFNELRKTLAYDLNHLKSPAKDLLAYALELLETLRDYNPRSFNADSFTHKRYQRKLLNRFSTRDIQYIEKMRKLNDYYDSHYIIKDPRSLTKYPDAPKW